MQLEMVIEETGHVFSGSAARFHDVKTTFGELDFDIALVDIDLADGRSGGEVARWLEDRGKPSLFITGQEQLALAYEHDSLGILIKPVSEATLRATLEAISNRLGEAG
jgi:DNA-binding LytR/AlgR family response regulator